MCVGMVGGGGGNPALSHYYMYAYGWLNVGVLFVYIILQVATMVAIVAFPPSLLLLLPSPPSSLHLPPHKAEIYLYTITP